MGDCMDDDKRFIRPFVYVCNHCKAKYDKKVDSCINCGSNEITKTYSDIKYRYIKSNGIKLTSDGKTKVDGDEAEKKVDNRLDEVKLGALFLVVLVVFILIMGFLYSVIINGGSAIGEFLNNLFGVDSRNTTFGNISVIVLFVLVCFLIFGIMVLLDRHIILADNKIKNNVQLKIINRSKKSVSPSYLLVVGLKYDIIEVLKAKNKYVVRVKYKTSNGVDIRLNSKKEFSSFPTKTIDLLINPNDMSDYLIDFGLEKKFEKYS